MTTTSFVLSGLDGSNPLGFFAALGALRLLDAIHPGKVRLGWRQAGGWVAMLAVDAGVLPTAELDALAGALHEQLATRRTRSSITGLFWEEDNENGERKEKRNLRSPPKVWRAWAATVLADPTCDRLDHDLVAATAAEAELDNKGKLVPTVFEFTAGQQMFLKLVEALYWKVTTDDMLEALRGPWTRSRELPVLGWDAGDNRDYALRASAPSDEKKKGTPGADALAVWGISMLPVLPCEDGNRTTAAGGRWKSQWFRWALWRAPLDVDSLRSTLPLGARADLAAQDNSARGFGVRLETMISRADQGGRGSFAPARPRA